MTDGDAENGNVASVVSNDNPLAEKDQETMDSSEPLVRNNQEMLDGLDSDEPLAVRSQEIMDIQYHDFEESLTCKICKKVFSDRVGFTRHSKLLGRCGTKKKYPKRLCTHCGKLVCHGSIAEHMREHEIDRRFPCTVCNKSFTSTYKLKLHMRNHTGELC